MLALISSFMGWEAEEERQKEWEQQRNILTNDNSQTYLVHKCSNQLNPLTESANISSLQKIFDLFPPPALP